MKDQVLSTAEDLVVVNSKDKDNVVFAFPLKGEVAEHYFNQTLANSRKYDVRGFNRFWKFDQAEGLINGSSTLLALRLDTKLRPDGFWIPTIEEGMFLDEQGKLPNGVYRDFGMAVYSNTSPNQVVANGILKGTRRKTPLVVPFKALDYWLNADFPEGVKVFLTQNQSSIKSAKKAEEVLSKVSYKADSGARRVVRYNVGNWYAYWYNLGYSNSNGRVDWLCGEATRAELRQAYDKLIERKYAVKLKELDEERKKLNLQREADEKAFVDALK